MQALFWSSDVNKMNADKDKAYIIQRILAKGSLSDLRWLADNYPKQTIRQVFIRKPQKQYTPGALNFVSRYIIKTKRKPVAKKYVKSLH